MLKRVFSFVLSMLIVSSSICVSAENMVTLYAEGKSKAFPQSKVEAQLKVGWYKEPVQRLYAEGKSKLFFKSQVASQLKVGWYTEPVQRLYTKDRSKVFPQSKVAAQLKVGWYTEPLANEEDVLEVAGRKYWLGMPEKELGTADETFKGMKVSAWKVYGTKTYDNFLVAGIENGKIVTLLSIGAGFEYNGQKAGEQDKSPNPYKRKTLLDDHNDYLVYGVRLYSATDYADKMTSEILAGESKLIFHLVNAFRRHYGKSLLKWNDNAAISARLHSEDMANKNYFSHTSLDGRSYGERMSAQNVPGYPGGENIAAGQTDGINAFAGWVKSFGHRENMLGDFGYIGVGIAVKSSTMYTRYYTQNFGY